MFPNLYLQATIVREASGRVRAYRDGYLRVDVASDGGCFQISNNLLRFFQDDNQEPNEASSGNVARIRLFDAPMTTAQVQGLDRVPNAAGGGKQSLLFSSGRDGNAEIYTMNTSRSNQFRLTNTPTGANTSLDITPNWSPNGQKIAFASLRDGNYEIYLMNPDGSGQTKITDNPLTD